MDSCDEMRQVSRQKPSAKKDSLDGRVSAHDPRPTKGQNAIRRTRKTLIPASKPWLKPPQSTDGRTKAAQKDQRLGSIIEISSTLNPFVRLPIEITDQEKSLLQFYLKLGRRRVWGTSDKPKYCPAFHIARTLMQICPIFILGTIIVAEATLGRMTGQKPQPAHYSRRAQIYKAVNHRLSDESAPMYLKMFAITDLAMVEFTTGHPHLQNVHIQALDDLIGMKGGLSAYLARFEDVDVMCMSARFYAGQFIRAEVDIPTAELLQAVVRRYVEYLHRIREWTLSGSQRPYLELVNEHRSRLSPLIDYFYHLVEVWLSNDGTSQPFHQTSGAHFCAFSLAITLVELHKPYTSTFQFLYRVQENMLASAELSHQHGKQLSRLHAFAAAHIIAHTRSEVVVKGAAKSEIRIAQAIVDAQKMFLLLSTSRRTDIVSCLVQAIFASPTMRGSGSDNETVFGDENLQQLKTEIFGSWKTRQSTAPSTLPQHVLDSPKAG